MIKSEAIAIGTTPCWAGCIYELNPEIAGIEPVNSEYFEEQDDDNT